MARETTLGKVREAIADAAGSVASTVASAAVDVADAADKHVVKPVGKKLGLISKTKKGKAKAKRLTKSEAKDAQRTAKARMMTKSVPAKKAGAKGTKARKSHPPGASDYKNRFAPSHSA